MVQLPSLSILEVWFLKERKSQLYRKFYGPKGKLKLLRAAEELTISYSTPDA